jgi:RNA polymerase sigma-70 factor (ECF subfamily)
MTTWLFGICMRVAAANRRRAYNRREQITSDVPEEAADHLSPEEAAAKREARARLDGVLDLMDIEKRAIFVMFELDEVPCEDMAEMLGVPIGTVYSRLHAARKDFQAALARYQLQTARSLVRGGGR